MTRKQKRHTTHSAPPRSRNSHCDLPRVLHSIRECTKGKISLSKGNASTGPADAAGGGESDTRVPAMKAFARREERVTCETAGIEKQRLFSSGSFQPSERLGGVLGGGGVLSHDRGCHLTRVSVGRPARGARRASVHRSCAGEPVADSQRRFCKSRPGKRSAAATRGSPVQLPDPTLGVAQAGGVQPERQQGAGRDGGEGGDSILALQTLHGVPCDSLPPTPKTQPSAKNFDAGRTLLSKGRGGRFTRDASKTAAPC